MRDFESTQVISINNAPQNTAETIIRFGKINCIIKERFASQGKEIDEILEKLIVEKCRQPA